MPKPSAGSRKPASKPPVRRLIIALPRDLHRRIKLSCAARGIYMSEAIREALKRTPWPLGGA
jgi:hypothetical protein